MSDPRPAADPRPSPPAAASDDHAMEVRLSKLLTLGTTTSAAVVLVGIAIYLWRHSGDRLDFSSFRAHADELNAPTTILSKALALDAPAIMQLGVLLLVLTPVARVAFTLVAFLIRRDWMYVVIAAIVLVVLSLGLVGIRLH
jgi:uncharacterized membrane protein